MYECTDFSNAYQCTELKHINVEWSVVNENRVEVELCTS